MTRLKGVFLATALFGAVSLGSGSSALALPAGGAGAWASDVFTADTLIQLAQGRPQGARRGGRGAFRGRPGGLRGGRGGGRGPGRGGGRRGGGIDPGAAAAIGLGLGVLGAIAGQSAAKQRRLEIIEETRRQRAIEEAERDRGYEYERRSRRRARVYDRDVEYCIRTFRSYRPETGTYVDYDGNVRRCP